MRLLRETNLEDAVTQLAFATVTVVLTMHSCLPGPVVRASSKWLLKRKTNKLQEMSS